MALATSEQLRAARAMLAIDQRKLAAISGVSQVTIAKMERAIGVIPGRHETVRKLQRALEKAGVEFRPDGWVRLGERTADTGAS